MTDFRVQSGTAVFGASSNTINVTLADAVDPLRAFPMLSSSLGAGSGRDITDTVKLNNDDLGALITNWDGTGFTLTRQATAEAVDHRYEWQVWEDRTENQAVDGWYMRGLKTTDIIRTKSNVTTGVHGAIVDTSKCVPITVACSGNGTNRAWGEMCHTVEMTLTARIRIKRDPFSTLTKLTVNTVVLEFGTAWKITNNLSAAIDLPFTNPLIVYSDLTGCGPEDWESKIYFPSMRCTSGQDRMTVINLLTFALDGATDVLRTRPDPAALWAGGNTPTLYVHIAHHPLLVVEHRDSDQVGTSVLVNGDEDDTALLGSYSLADTGILGTTCNPGALAYPGAHWTWKLLNGTTVRWRRGKTGPNPASWSYQIIQFPRIKPGLGGSRRITRAPGSVVSAAAPRGRQVAGSGGAAGVTSAPGSGGGAGSPGAR